MEVGKSLPGSSESSQLPVKKDFLNPDFNLLPKTGRIVGAAISVEEKTIITNNLLKLVDKRMGHE